MNRARRSRDRAARSPAERDFATFGSNLILVVAPLSFSETTFDERQTSGFHRRTDWRSRGPLRVFLDCPAGLLWADIARRLVGAGGGHFAEPVGLAVCFVWGHGSRAGSFHRVAVRTVDQGRKPALFPGSCVSA